MADEEIEEPSQEAQDDDPATALLERIDSVEGFGAPEETPPPTPERSRRELDRLVDEILDEELKRLSERQG